MIENYCPEQACPVLGGAAGDEPMLAQAQPRPQTLDQITLDRIYRRLAEITAPERVTTDFEVRRNYGRDMTEQVAPTLPDVVVQPISTKEVEQIVKLANEEHVPITPFAAGANVGGLTLPHKGGIMVDCKRMRRIIEINRECKYILVEPGVTFGHLRRLFDTELPEFRYSFPFSPPWTSVGLNALLHGLGSLSVMYGSADNFINGLEVVLPTGEVVQVGNHAVNGGKYWYGRSPLPDLAGLFIGWQGTSGIVTKIALQLTDRPQYLAHFALLPKDTNEFFAKWVHELDKMHLCDEIGCGYFPPKVARGLVPDDMIDTMGRMMFLLTKKGFAKFFNKYLWPLLKVITIRHPFALARKFARFMKKPDENTAFLICGLTVTGATKQIFNAKVAALKQFVGKRMKHAMLIPPDDFAGLKDVFMSILDLPAQLPAFYDLQGGGLTWVGSYVPPPTVADGLRRGEEILRKYKFFPVGVLRPMKSDHYFVLRFILPFNSADEADKERAGKANRELADMILDIGGVPYKMAPWMAQKVWKKADPSFFNLLKRIKDLLDPNGIMNPGKLVVGPQQEGK